MEQSTKYQNKYRVASTRLKNWDYAGKGMYFVTICTKDRQCYFGMIQNNKMDLSPVGKMAADYWREIPKHFPFVTLDEFVVMPNHVHGIVVINKNNMTVETPHWGVSTSMSITNAHSNNNKNKIGGFNPNWKPNSLGSIINQFKSICTKHILKLHDPHFQWQARFHEHIIRDELSLEKIRQYIHDNPGKWDLDKNNPDAKIPSEVR